MTIFNNGQICSSVFVNKDHFIIKYVDPVELWNLTRKEQALEY